MTKKFNFNFIKYWRAELVNTKISKNVTTFQMCETSELLKEKQISFMILKLHDSNFNLIL